MQEIKTEMINDLPHIHPDQVAHMQDDWQIIDVRGADEFNGELGHIANSQQIEKGNDVEAYLRNCPKEQKILFVCRSGNRSGQVTFYAQSMGFTNTYNMIGGMLLWNELNLPKG